MKEKILDVNFDTTPMVKVRVIRDGDSLAIIKNKEHFPFELVKDIKVKIETTEREFCFVIRSGYCWNGADIPKPLFFIGQSKDNNYLIASMVHDYMLEYRGMIYNTVLNRKLCQNEYRRLTSLIFREILKKHKTNVVKANFMGFGVDFFQKYFEFLKWNNM